MTTFRQFLNEGFTTYSKYDINDVNEKIRKECKPYLSLLKGRNPLIRGMNVPVDFDYNDLGKKDVRMARKARKMSHRFADRLNDWLEDNGHNRRDRSVFAMSIKNEMYGVFGKMYAIYPIGKMSYTWIRSKDINVDDRKTGWDEDYVIDYFIYVNEFKNYGYPIDKVMKMKQLPDDLSKLYTDEDLKFIQNFPKWFTTDKGFDEAYEKGYEFWISCKNYYVLNRNHPAINILMEK